MEVVDGLHCGTERRLDGGGAAIMQRSHDYKLLVRGWRAVARSAGARLQLLATAGTLPVYFLRTAVENDPRAIYLSAGIHGDESAGPAALLAWAEQNSEKLRAYPFLIFPCLNPWGLLNNSRYDAQGVDLNRTFSDKHPPTPVRELLRLIDGQRFALSLTLHEDYDATGFYVYEVMRRAPFWGEQILRKARPLIAIDSRANIDRRRARRGLVRRQFKPQRFPEMPESIYLHRRHSYRTFTTETPSEFALETRIAAHVATIEEFVRLAKNSPRVRKGLEIKGSWLNSGTFRRDAARISPSSSPRLTRRNGSAKACTRSCAYLRRGQPGERTHRGRRRLK